jgi:putative transposase
LLGARSVGELLPDPGGLSRNEHKSSHLSLLEWIYCNRTATGTVRASTQRTNSPRKTVFYHFRRFRLSGLWHRVFIILRALERKRNSKDPNPSAAIVDSQSVKTVEESAGSLGYDAHKHVKGRKRHLLVDTLGLPLSIYVTPADVQDRVGARCLLARLKPLAPHLKKIWADGAYGGEPFAKWCQEQGGWDLEVVEPNREAEGFEVIPKRWIVERTFSWIGRNRRMSTDYERKVQTSERLMKVATMRLILRRLARKA